MLPQPWRTRVENDHPEWLRFLEAVAQDAVEAALEEGDHATREVLLDQSAGAAVLLMSGVELVDSIAACEALDRENAMPLATSADDRKGILDVYWSFRDDPVMLDAFERYSSLLAPDIRAAVVSVVEGAREFTPRYPNTRSRLEINARGTLPKLSDAILARFAPVMQKLKALEQLIKHAEPWQVPDLSHRRSLLLKEFEQIHREIAAELIVAERGDGLIRLNPVIRAIRSAGEIGGLDDPNAGSQ